MSLSYLPQEIINSTYVSLCRYIKGFSCTSLIVLETNKRTVIQCLDRTEAKDLAYNLRAMNYSCFIKAGLKSSHWYLQISF